MIYVKDWFKTHTYLQALTFCDGRSGSKHLHCFLVALSVYLWDFWRRKRCFASRSISHNEIRNYSVPDSKASDTIWKNPRLGPIKLIWMHGVYGKRQHTPHNFEIPNTWALQCCKIYPQLKLIPRNTWTISQSSSVLSRAADGLYSSYRTPHNS